MKKIRLLRVDFENELRPYEISSFRGAVIEKAGRDNILFHNHIGKESYLYGYPVIQYKTINHKASLICIDYGIDEVHHLFQQKNLNVRIGDNDVELKVAGLKMDNVNLNVWDKIFDYRINKWLALSGENYLIFKEIKDERLEIEFLEKILIGNILAFAKGVKWNVEKAITLKIKSINEKKPVPFKGLPHIGFNLEFKTNVFLPDYIGLGKGVSRGFGTIRKINSAVKSSDGGLVNESNPSFL